MTNHKEIQIANAIVRREISVRAKQPGRLSKSRIIDQVLSLLFRAIKLADSFSGVPGREKKQWVLSQIETLVDMLLPMVPMWWFLAPFRPWLLERAKREIMDLADMAVETILQNLREATEGK